MSDERDFAIDDGELRAAADLAMSSPPPPEPESESGPEPESGPAPVQPPRVLIQYRNRGIHSALLPPLLILVVALGITSYQRQGRLRPAPPPALRSKTAGPAMGTGLAAPRRRIIMVEAAGTGAAVDPITFRSGTPPPPTAPDLSATAVGAAVAIAPAPPPAAAPAGSPAEDPVADAGRPAAAESGPFSPEAIAGSQDDAPPLEPPAPLTSPRGGPLAPDAPELAFAPVAVVAALTRDTPEPGGRESKMTKEQIWQEIQDEARQKKAEQVNLGREVEGSKSREFFEAIKKAHLERRPFHDELRRILIELKQDAGPEINSLCDRYGRGNVHPDIQKVVTHALNRAAAGLRREAKVKMMRLQGLPEPVILDALANELDPMIRGRRGGPKDRNGVRVVAAKLLLTFPPPPVPEESSATP